MIARPAPPCVAVLAALACSCAAALKEAPPLAELAGAPLLGGGEAAGPLVARAGDLEARRDLDGMRRAAELYLQAAAATAAGGSSDEAAAKTKVDALVAAARTEVWLADHEPEPAPRRDAAARAVHASQWCGRLSPERPECAYWLGASLGVQAREHPATGLSALPQIEAALKDAAARAPALDEGGPDRSLSLLYLRAPGWPAGPGDPERGLEHARRAVAISPLFPPNLMALAEALAAAGDAEASLATWRKSLELARAAQGRDPDASDWIAEVERALGP